jgi:hypothetical protein
MMWPSLDAFFRDPCHGGRGLIRDVGVRSTSNAHRWCQPRIWSLDVERWLNDHGIPEGEYIISNTPEGNQWAWKALQGELGFHPVEGYWVLYGAEQGGYQREILNRDPDHVRRVGGNPTQTWTGNEVLRMLHKHCDPQSYEGLMNLFELYTVNHRYPTIEFAVIPANAPRIGRIPTWNTLIWEIRHY